MSLLDGHSDWWWGKDEEFPIAQKCVVEIGYVRCLSVSVFLGFCVCEFVILYARGNVMAILSGHQKISKHFQVFFPLELDPGSLHCSLRCDEIQPIPLLVFPWWGNAFIGCIQMYGFTVFAKSLSTLSRTFKDYYSWKKSFWALF